MGLILRVNGKYAPTLSARISRAVINDVDAIAADTATLVVVGDGANIPTTSARIGFFTETEQRLGAGDYVIDSIDYNARGGVVTFDCKSYDAESALRAPAEKSFVGETLGAIFTNIAQKYGLKAVVATPFNAIVPDGAIQAKESEMQFLRRLAEKSGADFSIKNGHLILVGRNQKSVTDATLPNLAIDAAAADNWISWTIKKSNQFKSVTAVYLADDGITQNSYTAGEGEPKFKMPQIFKTKKEAETATGAAIKNLSQKATNLTIATGLLPTARAESPLTLENSPPALMAAKFKVSKIRHILTATAAAETQINAVAV